MKTTEKKYSLKEMNKMCYLVLYFSKENTTFFTQMKYELSKFKNKSSNSVFGMVKLLELQSTIRNSQCGSPLSPRFKAQFFIFFLIVCQISLWSCVSIVEIIVFQWKFHAQHNFFSCNKIRNDKFLPINQKTSKCIDFIRFLFKSFCLEKSQKLTDLIHTQ